MKSESTHFAQRQQQQSFRTRHGKVSCKVASGFFERLVGLLRNSELPVEAGVLFPKCNAVHTFGMRFSIDVLFLDTEYRIIKKVTMIPWKVQWARGANSVLELTAGAAKYHDLKIGERLCIA